VPEFGCGDGFVDQMLRQHARHRLDRFRADMTLDQIVGSAPPSTAIIAPVT
jgi:hypothetical protein